MANEKFTPEQLAQFERIKKELDSGLTSRLTLQGQYRSAQTLRSTVYAKYGKYHLATFPDDYPVTINGKLILNERDDPNPTPFPCVLRDMTPAFDRKAVKEARRKLIKEMDSFEHLMLSADDWAQLIDLETERAEKIPMPFYHEALQNFTACFDDDFAIPFRRSELPRIKYNGYDIVPMVDCLITVSGNQPLLFGIGLIDVELDIHQVAMYWFGGVNERHHETIVDILTTYFYSQWAFHTCPERVIEVRPGEPDPFDNQPEPVSVLQPSKKQPSDRPHRVSVGRKIYVREYPSYSGDGSREYERHCRCWYVHGFMRTNHKTGKQTWINGYFKGPDRDIPAARRHVKNYVLD